MLAKREQAKASNPNAPLALRDLFLKSIKLPPQAVVSSFIAQGSEIDPEPLMHELRSRGCTIVLPVVTSRGEPLIFRQYNPGDMLEPGAMQIPTPVATAPERVPDVLIVPLLAFDRTGSRLGYGGGYYDRTLTALRSHKAIQAAGIGYAIQELTEVPVGSGDARLDCIVTEIKVFQP